MARKQETILLENGGGAEKRKTTKKQNQSFYRFVSFIGIATFQATEHLYKTIGRLFKRVGEKWAFGLKTAWNRLLLFGKNTGEAFARPFLKAKRGFELICQNAKTARENHTSVLAAVKEILVSGFKRNKWFFKGLLNYGAAAFGIAVVIVVVQIMTRLNVAVAVAYNGKPLGYIESEAVYSSASKLLQQRIISEEEIELDQPVFTLAVVDKNKLADKNMLVDSMIRSASVDIVESNGVYIGGEFYGAVADATAITQAVDKILAKYQTGVEGEKVELVKPVEIKKGLFLTKSVIPEEKILSLLNSEVQGEVTYTVQSGDTPTGIAKKNGMAYSEFKTMNPNCETKFVVGQKVYLAKSEPFMQVQVTRRETYRQEVMFKTQTTKDSRKSTSYTAITQYGRKGINEITADVQYINGVEVGRTVVDTKVLQTAVDQKIIKGTKIPSGASDSALNLSGSALGKFHFIWPVAGGQISSHYGRRWGSFHSGLDIRAPRGTAVYAAESGTVELSRWYSGYGYCVIINHGGGVKTLYGHASQLVAKQGQQVKKGDVIMLVGMTGQATGNHLHFEIRNGGSRLNPLPYIGR